MIRSKIFFPKRLSDLIERANVICAERRFYQIAKTDVVRIIYKNQFLFKCDVQEAARNAVVSNSIVQRYVGLDVIARVNDGVIITATIPREIMEFARDINKILSGRRSVRAWQVVMKLFAQILEQNSDDDIVNAFVTVAERDTILAGKII